MKENNWFKEYAPEFRMMGNCIKVLFTPNEFYLTLKNLLPTAKQRIVISSLYIGTGELEKHLVDAINEALTNSNDSLKVQILLDYTRGSRGECSSRTLVLPLLNKQRDVKVAFYHTPDLRGFRKKILPERWNEVIGLQHMKIYVVDNTVLMSGANLSHDYFTNRQDRYIVVEDPHLADFFQSLVATVSTFSIQLNPDNSESLHQDWLIHPYLGDYSSFKNEAQRRIEDLILTWKGDSSALPNSLAFTKRLLFNLGIDVNKQKVLNTDSKIYPLVQMGPFKIKNDENATQLLFQTAPVGSKIQLATGYFNLTSNYRHFIINNSTSNYEILTASPKANGFFGGRGISGFIPKLYLYLAKIFLKKVEKSNQQYRVVIDEFERENWTFHAKGLWYYPPESILPTVSLIGSPNFGYRSVKKDLEAQIAIVTSNVNLMKQLHLEQQRLYQHSSPLTNAVLNKSERHIPMWVRWFAMFFRNYF